MCTKYRALMCILVVSVEGTELCAAQPPLSCRKSEAQVLRVFWEGHCVVVAFPEWLCYVSPLSLVMQDLPAWFCQWEIEQLHMICGGFPTWLLGREGGQKNPICKS